MESPYKNSYLVKYNDGEVSLEREKYYPTNTTQFTNYTVVEGDTIQHIALRFYNDTGQWYKIADVNELYFPFEELTPGLIILIPQ